MRFGEACGVGHYLGKLAARYRVVRSEGAISIAVDGVAAGETVDEGIEGAALRHICELNGTGGRN